MILSNKDFEKLLKMLEEDRKPTKAMLRAGERYKKLVGWKNIKQQNTGV